MRPIPGGFGMEIDEYREWTLNDHVMEWKNYVIAYELRSERVYIDGIQIMNTPPDFTVPGGSTGYFTDFESSKSDDHHLELTVRAVENGRITAIGYFALFFDVRYDESNLRRILTRSELSRKYRLIPSQSTTVYGGSASTVASLREKWIPERNFLLDESYFINTKNEHCYFHSDVAMEGMLILPNGNPTLAGTIMVDIFTTELIKAVLEDYAASYDPRNDSRLPAAWETGRDAVENLETDLQKAFSGEKDVVYKGYRDFSDSRGGEEATVEAEVLLDFAFHDDQLIRMAEFRTYADAETAREAFLDAANDLILAYGDYEGDPRAGAMRWLRPEIVLSLSEDTVMIARIREGIDDAVRAEVEDMTMR